LRLTGLASTGIAVAYNTSVPIFCGFAPFHCSPAGCDHRFATGAKFLSDCDGPFEADGPGHYRPARQNHL